MLKMIDKSLLQNRSACVNQQCIRYDSQAEFGREPIIWQRDDINRPHAGEGLFDVFSPSRAEDDRMQTVRRHLHESLQSGQCRIPHNHLLSEGAEENE